jgi:hypothetical protein
VAEAILSLVRDEAPSERASSVFSSTWGRSSRWTWSSTFIVPTASSGSYPSTHPKAGFAYLKVPSGSTIVTISEEFSTTERSHRWSAPDDTFAFVGLSAL